MHKSRGPMREGNTSSYVFLPSQTDITRSKMTKNKLFDQLQLAQALKAHWPSERCQHEVIAANYFKLVKQALIRGIHMANEEQIKLQLIPVAICIPQIRACFTNLK